MMFEGSRSEAGRTIPTGFGVRYGRGCSRIKTEQLPRQGNCLPVALSPASSISGVLSMPSRRWQLAVKHAGDRVAAGVLLLLLSPAFAVIGLRGWPADGLPIFL